MDTLTMPVGWEALESPAAVNVGNPHVIFFVPDCDAVELERLGPQIERDPLFPQRINVNVATATARDAIRLRVWERGAGLTLACGTGACATAVAAMRRGLADRSVTVTLPGGPLRIDWRPDGGIVMTGAAAESFRGAFDPADYGAARGAVG
jgi:diaminopimelate epimerase